VPGVLLALAAAGFLLLALRRFQPSLAFAVPAGASGSAIGHLASRLGQLRGASLGLALGLLPCGMIYAALAASASSGPVIGGLGMLACGLGTVPALIAVGLLGHAVARRWHTTAHRAAPWVLTANGVLLLALSWRALAGA